MNLNLLPLNTPAKVVGFSGSTVQQTQLRRMGLREDVRVEVTHRAWFTRTVDVRVGSRTLSLRRIEANGVRVQVELVSEDNGNPRISRITRNEKPN